LVKYSARVLASIVASVGLVQKTVEGEIV
jgi:uncharacterized protein (DUF2235 family)